MKKKLVSVTIKDCIVETFCSGGKGGQHQNATKSGVRIKHFPSGAVGECREERYQHVNKQRAFKRMAESKKMQLWLKIESIRVKDKKSINEIIDEQMQVQNLKTEIKNKEGKWIVNDGVMPTNEM